MEDYLELVKKDKKHAIEHFKEALFYTNKAKNNNIFVRTLLPSNHIEQIFSAITKKKEGKELFGLLFSVKDVFSVSNQNLTLGLKEPLITRNNRHAKLVNKFIELGASLYGITNLDPLEIEARGENCFYGNVANTVFKSKISGGSSSGAAASVGGNIVDFAIGSDSGGSIRIPAACHGLVGLVGSEEVLPTKGMLKVSSEFSKAGIITKNLDDLEFLVKHLNKKTKKISTVLLPNMNELSKVTKKEIFSEFENLVKKISNTKELNIKIEFDNLKNLRKKIIAKELTKLTNKFNITFETLPKSAKALLTLSEKISENEYSDALDEITEFREIHNELLKNSTILMPTLNSKVPESNKSIPDNFNNLLCYSSVFNFPSLSFPLKVKEAGEIPLSLQLVGGNISDLSLIDKARELSNSL